jgi:serine phosphatase RsbU (regulator of sigma subunit)
MKKAFSVLFFLSVFLVIKAQEGIPLLTHYMASREIENQSWAIAQDENKVMLFANRKGILSFDGGEWTPLRIPVLPYSLKMDPFDYRIYYGGENDYGYIEKSQMGTYVYRSLSDSAEVGQITKILLNDSIIWFYSAKTITKYNASEGNNQHHFRSAPGQLFSGMFIAGGNAYVNLSGKGLHLISNDTIIPFPSGSTTAGREILFSLPYDGKLVLVGTDEGRLMLFDGQKFRDYQAGDDGYLKNNILSDGIMLGDSLYAFSTFDGGALIMEKFSGKVKYTINNQTGLPDDEIYSIGCDSSGGLWLSHQFGLTRADLNLPVSNFSIYPGLTGNLTNSLRYRGELYVATSEGVFYLIGVRNYSEVDVLKKDEMKQDKESTRQENPVQPGLREKSTDIQTRRRGIFNKIFGKKDQAEKKTGKINEPGASAGLPVAPPVVRYSWQKVSKLKSIDYTYRKVAGLNEKCRQLIATENGILAATNHGVFFINDHKASIIADKRYVNFIAWEPSGGKYAVATSQGYFLLSGINKKWSVEIPDPEFINPLYSVVQPQKDVLWLGGDDIAWKATLASDAGNVRYEQFRIESSFPQKYNVNLINDTIFLMTETGINFYDTTAGGFLPYKTGLTAGDINDVYIYPLSNVPLVKRGYDWIFNASVNPVSAEETAMLRLFDDIISVTLENDNIWIIDGGNSLLRINRKKSAGIDPATELFVKTIYNEKGVNFDLSNVVFHRGDNVIYFKIVAPAYFKKNLTQYQFKIPKIMSDWSQWSNDTEHSMGIYRSGDYTLLVRARDMWGNIGEPVSLSFKMKAPFTRTTFFYVLIILIVSLIKFLLVRVRETRLKEKNRILEEKVRERTAEIEAQKEEITSSIEYASRIQMAMLPVNDLFKSLFPDFFIIFKPRDIVSGDFYWIGEDEKNIYVAVADCTGHGVPGAFMSALGISTLNEIIANNSDLQANTILNLLREKIKGSLHQTGKEGEAADGMDISFVIFKKYRKKIQFAGAYNSLLIASDGDLNEYKADRMPIGIHYGAEIPFTNYEINVKKGDVVYILTDGLCDQFGGPEGIKYKKASLKRLLSGISGLSMTGQKMEIEKEYESWKGNIDQVDDITLIGIRI